MKMQQEPDEEKEVFGEIFVCDCLFST